MVEVIFSVFEAIVPLALALALHLLKGQVAPV